MSAAETRTRKNPHQQWDAEDSDERDGVGQVHNTAGRELGNQLDYAPALRGTQWTEVLSERVISTMDQYAGQLSGIFPASGVGNIMPSGKSRIEDRRGKRDDLLTVRPGRMRPGPQSDELLRCSCLARLRLFGNDHIFDLVVRSLRDDFLLH